MLSQKMESLAAALGEKNRAGTLGPEDVVLAVFLIQQYAGDIARMERVACPVAPPVEDGATAAPGTVVSLDRRRSRRASPASRNNGGGPAA